MNLLLLAHLAATLVMVGIIWFVQVVHYPLFSRVGKSVFPRYSEDHSRLTTYVVGPPMLLEAATAALLLFFRPIGIPAFLPWTGAILLAVVWLSTALLQVPRHKTLGLGFETNAWSALVLTNWLRTVCWSLRGVLALLMISLTMK